MTTTHRIDLHAAAPDVHAAMTGLDRAASAQLDPLLAELVRIRVSQINGCAFCLSLHTRAATELGESRLETLSSWRGSHQFTAAERAALDLAEAMTTMSPSGVPDHIFTTARNHFPETRLAHLLWTIAAINTWNRMSIATSR
jgi:AhpD family alkylhydroperoxidase